MMLADQGTVVPKRNIRSRYPGRGTKASIEQAEPSSGKHSPGYSIFPFCIYPLIFFHSPSSLLPFSLVL
jgi:hypothetical protein